MHFDEIQWIRIRQNNFSCHLQWWLCIVQSSRCAKLVKATWLVSQALSCQFVQHHWHHHNHFCIVPVALQNLNILTMDKLTMHHICDHQIQQWRLIWLLICHDCPKTKEIPKSCACSQQIGPPNQSLAVFRRLFWILDRTLENMWRFPKCLLVFHSWKNHEILEQNWDTLWISEIFLPWTTFEI